MSLAFFEALCLDSKSLQAGSVILRKFYNSSTSFTTVAWGGKKHPSRGTKSEMLAAKGSKVGVSSAYLENFANKLGIMETMKIDRNMCFFLKV